MAKSITAKCHKRGTKAGAPGSKSYLKAYGACLRKKYGVHHGFGSVTRRKRRRRK